MRTILILLILTITHDAFSQESSIKYVEIGQYNHITGKTGYYKIKGSKLLSYKSTNKFNLFKHRVILTNREKDTVNLLLNTLINNLSSERVFADPSIIDGFTWFISIKIDNFERLLTITNCRYEDLDQLILFLNSKLKSKYKFIFPMKKMYGDKECYPVRSDLSARGR